MLPPGCPAWQYSSHPQCPQLLPLAATKLLSGIMTGGFPADKYTPDTRPIHRDLFTGLEPPGHDYYVGNYRGFHKKCLRNYEVFLRGDPLACSKATTVHADITRFGTEIVKAIRDLETAIASAPQTIDPAQKTIAIVRIACLAFVRFLTIHPYADGNGHVARSLLWIILRHFGYIPDKWTIDPRPPFPAYGAMIAMHRRGTTSPLEQFVLSSISRVI